MTQDSFYERVWGEPEPEPEEGAEGQLTPPAFLASANPNSSIAPNWPIALRPDQARAGDENVSPFIVQCFEEQANQLNELRELLVGTWQALQRNLESQNELRRLVNDVCHQVGLVETSVAASQEDMRRQMSAGLRQQTTATAERVKGIETAVETGIEELRRELEGGLSAEAEQTGAIIRDLAAERPELEADVTERLARVAVAFTQKMASLEKSIDDRMLAHQKAEMSRLLLLEKQIRAKDSHLMDWLEDRLEDFEKLIVRYTPEKDSPPQAKKRATPTKKQAVRKTR